MSVSLLIALGGGLASAVFYLSVRVGEPLAAALTYFAPLPLLAVGLSRGLVASIIAVAAGTVALAFGVGGTATLIYIGTAGLPALIVTRQAMLSRPATAPGAVEWYPAGLLLGWITLYAVFLLAAVTLVFSGAEGGLEGEIRRAVTRVLDAHAQTRGMSVDPRFRAFAEAQAPHLPGWLLSAWVVVFVVNSTVAQGLLSRVGQAGRPSPAYREIEPPQWLIALLAGSVALAFLPGSIGGFGRNAVPVLSTPFLLCGLAVIHTLSHRVPGRAAVLATLYVMLAVFGWLVALIALIGLAEPWIGLRRRFGNSGSKPEGE